MGDISQCMNEWEDLNQCMPKWSGGLLQDTVSPMDYMVHMLFKHFSRSTSLTCI
jgi:hypothetical protein